MSMPTHTHTPMPHSQQRSLRVERILLVDGTDQFAHRVRASLGPLMADCEFVVTDSMASALAPLGRHRFDAALLVLPEQSAMSHAARLGRAHPDLPFIVLDEDHDHERALAWAEAGVHDYLCNSEIDAQRLARAIEFAVQRLRAQRDSRALANKDRLTGLGNRAYMNAMVDSALARARRERSLLAVMFIGLDAFTAVNEMHGQDAGDLALSTIAERLRRCSRESDSIARIGGDQFAVLLEDLHGLHDAHRLGRKFIRELQHPVAGADGAAFSCAASIGIALYPRSGEDCATLMHSADEALRKAKARARVRAGEHNRLLVHGDASVANPRVHALNELLDCDRLDTHYQPIVDLRSNRIIAVEALARWPAQAASTESMAPVEFIALAERSGLIGKLGEAVMRRSCQQLRSWQDSAGPDDLTMSVNVSALQLGDETLLELLDEALDSTSPKVLQVELTETAIMEDTRRSLRILKAIRDRGVRVAIDDFGTGHCSLSYLRDMPVDILKLDRSFVQTVDDQRGRALVGGIIRLAHDLDLRVIAEGIETPEQFERMRALGADAIQGFVISPAVPGDAVAVERWEQLAARIGNEVCTQGPA